MKRTVLDRLTDMLDIADIETSYYDKETGKIIFRSEDEELADDGFDDELSEGCRYIPLPGPHDLNDYEIMKDFSRSVDDNRKRNILLTAISGKGAFRCFRQSIEELEMEDEWYAFKKAAYRNIAREWCEIHGIDLSDSMNIDDFEKKFSYIIMSRAADYFDGGRVTSLKEKKRGNWTAVVEGSEDYTVVVRLDGKEIIYSDCNCPYDGDLCKHEGAVFLSIRERLKRRSKKDLSSGENPGVEQDSIRKKIIDDLIEIMDEDELRKTLTEILQYDKRRRDDFLLKYGREHKDLL
ncbi:MAG: UPF0158 family protein [Methanomassiliicoccaceae archaeon]|nr:UPF0158 family protein [Methanomassiliicoccaceae archaeon]